MNLDQPSYLELTPSQVVCPVTPRELQIQPFILPEEEQAPARNAWLVRLEGLGMQHFQADVEEDQATQADLIRLSGEMWQSLQGLAELCGKSISDIRKVLLNTRSGCHHLVENIVELHQRHLGMQSDFQVAIRDIHGSLASVITDHGHLVKDVLPQLASSSNTAISGLVEQITPVLKCHHQDLVEAAKQVDFLRQNLAGHDTRISDLFHEVRKLTQGISGQSGAFQEYHTALAAHGAQLAKFQAGLGDIEKKFQDLSESCANFQANVPRVPAGVDLSRLQARVEVAESRIEALSASLRAALLGAAPPLPGKQPSSLLTGLQQPQTLTPGAPTRTSLLETPQPTPVAQGGGVSPAAFFSQAESPDVVVIDRDEDVAPVMVLGAQIPLPPPMPPGLAHGGLPSLPEDSRLPVPPVFPPSRPAGDPPATRGARAHSLPRGRVDHGALDELEHELYPGADLASEGVPVQANTRMNPLMTNAAADILRQVGPWDGKPQTWDVWFSRWSMNGHFFLVSMDDNLKTLLLLRQFPESLRIRFQDAHFNDGLTYDEIVEQLHDDARQMVPEQVRQDEWKAIFPADGSYLSLTSWWTEWTLAIRRCRVDASCAREQFERCLRDSFADPLTACLAEEGKRSTRMTLRDRYDFILKRVRMLERLYSLPPRPTSQDATQPPSGVVHTSAAQGAQTAQATSTPQVTQVAQATPHSSANQLLSRRMIRGVDPCYICGQVGHWMSQCPQAWKNSQGSQPRRNSSERDPRGISPGRSWPSPGREGNAGRGWDNRQDTRQEKWPENRPGQKTTQVSFGSRRDSVDQDMQPRRGKGGQRSASQGPPMQRHPSASSSPPRVTAQNFQRNARPRGRGKGRLVMVVDEAELEDDGSQDYDPIDGQEGGHDQSE